MDARSKDSESPMVSVAKVKPAAEVSVSLKDQKDVSAAISTLRGIQDPMSVRVVLRGRKSVIVDFLDKMGDRIVDISTAVTLRGDKPASSR
jgi:hypothetical protein